MRSTLLTEEIRRAVELVGVSPEDLVSVTDIAEMLGVTRVTADRYARRPDFPEPLGHAAGGRVWLRAEVEEWARKTLPLRVGRPRKATET
jgi:predicted DNA-binding transcriptional regulator AlpA